MTRQICVWVRGIKKKAESAKVINKWLYAGEYFLNPELFDLEYRMIDDAAKAASQTTAALTELIGSYENPQEFGREWHQSVGGIKGDANTSGRTLIIDADDPAQNGVFMGTTRVGDLSTPKSLEFAMVHVDGGTKYANTVWTQVLKISNVETSPQLWIREQGFTNSGTGHTGAALADGTNLKTLIDSFSNAVGALQSTSVTFAALIADLKLTSTLDTTIAKATSILNMESNLVSQWQATSNALTAVDKFDQLYDINCAIANAALSLKYGPRFKHGDRIINNIVKFYSDRSAASIIQNNAIRKPWQVTEEVELMKLEDKTNNYNSTRSGGLPAAIMVGSGKGIESIIQALFDSNAMSEYWSQIGWRATERATKNDPHVQLLEKILTQQGLEELVIAHDKAVDSMLETELYVTPIDYVNMNPSPGPIQLLDPKVVPSPQPIHAAAAKSLAGPLNIVVAGVDPIPNLSIAAGTPTPSVGISSIVSGVTPPIVSIASVAGQ